MHAEGRIIHRGRTVATSQGELKDRAGKTLRARLDDVHDLSGQVRGYSPRLAASEGRRLSGVA